VSGVLNILQYNRHYYLSALAALVGLGILFGIGVIPSRAQILLLTGTVIVIWWFLGSLLASYYVYDYTGVTRWNWIPAALSRMPQTWLNIHSGLDESTETLTQLFPEGKGISLDIYDPSNMTELSIARARRSRSAKPSDAAGRLDALPATDKSRDTLFLLLSAHEVRNPVHRVKLFKEAARVMTDSGQLLLAEHVRDWRNFLAFGPGCLHFHSRGEWMRVAAEAGFTVEREGSITPLVRWFVLKKSAL
jgi:hypothetical protein